MLDFRINTFLEVCRTLNYTKAGENLGITQPGVSQHIRYLENYYGHKLFQNKGKYITLTAAGETLYHAASTMLHDEFYLRRKLDRVTQKEKKLILGVTMTIGEYVIAPRLAEYLRKNPKTSIHVIVSNTQELLKKISNNEIDFAIVEGYFPKTEYDCRKYAEIPFIAVSSAKHDFSKQLTINRSIKKKTLAMEDLFGERLIIREQGSGTREIFEKALEEKNYAVSDFANLVEINSMNAIKMLLQEDVGIAFLYKSAVEKELKEGTLKEIKIKDFQHSHDFTFIWNKGSIYADDYNELFEELK